MNSLDDFIHTNVKIEMWFPLKYIDDYKKFRKYAEKRNIYYGIYRNTVVDEEENLEIRVYSIYKYWKLKDYLMRHIDKKYWFKIEKI